MKGKLWRRSAVAAIVGTTFAGWGGAASAAGFQLQEQGAAGLGVAYSGQAAAVHDASTAFWNPAGMSLLPGRQVTAALAYVIPSTKFNNSGSTYSSAPFNWGNGGDGGESAFVPSLFGTWMINPQWSVGLAINAPFGLATEWDTPWMGQYHAIRSEIETLNINPSVSFKINNMISLGAGVSYQQIKAELTNAVPGPGGLAGLLNPVTGKVEGDDWAWGWNLGAMFEFGQGTRLGLTYRSTVSYTLEGDLSYSGTPAPAINATVPGQNIKADVKLPDTFSVGLSHQFNPQWRVLADYTWTGWDTIKTLDVQSQATGATLTSTALQFKDSWRIGVGVEYQLNQPWLLRAGLAYDNTPVQDAFRTPRLPDADKTWLAIGARYQPSPSWWLDFGYTYIWMDNASSELRPTGAEAFRGNLIGTYKANVQVLGAQASFKF